MAFISQTTYLKNPGKVCQINRAHPAARGLVSAYLAMPGGLRSITNLENASTTTTTTTNGYAVSPSSGLSFSKIQDPFSTTNEISVTIICTPSSVTASRVDFISRWDVAGTSAGQFVLLMSNGNTGKPQFYATYTPTFYNSGVGSNSLVANTRAIITGTANSALAAVYLNGKLESSTANSITLANRTDNIIIGNSATGSYQFSGNIELVLLHNRALTEAEVVQLHNKPYSLFLAPEKAIYFAEIGGAVNVNLIGNSSTVNRGTLGITHQNALTGISNTFSRGSLTPSLTKTLTGQSSIFSGGLFTTTHTNPLTGRSATFNGGTITPFISSGITLSGLSSTFSRGTLGLTHTNPLTGQGATFSGGLFSFGTAPITARLVLTQREAGVVFKKRKTRMVLG